MTPTPLHAALEKQARELAAENERQLSRLAEACERFLESPPAADLREAPLAQEGDRGNRKGHGVQIRQPDGDTTKGAA